MKITAISEQFDGGRDVFVQQEGAHVMLSVQATSGSDHGVSLLTPAQARAISTSLLEFAELADHFGSAGDE